MLSTILPSRKSVRIFKVDVDKLVYQSELSVINAEITIDIETPVNSVLLCTEGNVAEGDFALYIDDRFMIPMTISKVNKVDNSTNIELITNSYIDMMTLPIVSDDAGNVGFEAGNKKFAEPIKSMNLARENYVFGFDKVSNYYKFEGINQPVVVSVDEDSRSTTERNILVALLKSKELIIDMSFKKLNDKDMDITAEDYYLSVFINKRPNDDIWVLRAWDTGLISQSKIVYSNVEYNCLFIALVGSGGASFYYINKDGSKLSGYTLGSSKPPDWMSDASLPLKIKNKYVKVQDEVSVYDEALASLSDQYLNHEITLNINLDNEKLLYNSIFDFIYKKVYFIDLDADIINRTSYITAIKYLGKNDIEVTLGHSRTSLIKNIVTK